MLAFLQSEKTPMKNTPCLMPLRQHFMPFIQCDAVGILWGGTKDNSF